MCANVLFDDKKVIMKKYRLRRAGAQGATIEITLPKEAVEREARRLGISDEEAAEKLVGIWRYNAFPGLHLSFEKRANSEFQRSDRPHDEEVAPLDE
jgi:hypothetical protein